MIFFHASVIAAASGGGIPADTTAPILSSPLGIEVSASTGLLTVTTDENNGVLYTVVTTSATPPSKAQVKTGLNNAGTAAAFADNLTVVASGSQAFNAATGLTTGVAYYTYFMHEDASSNQSDVAASVSFTLVDDIAPILSVPLATETGTTTASLSVSTNEANGTLYVVVTTSATPPSAAQVKLGQNDGGTAAVFADDVAIASIGSKSFSATGLTAETVYYTYFMHEDAATNQSLVSAATSMTTDAVAGPADFVITTEAEWLANKASFASGDIIEIDGVIPERLELTGDFSPSGIVIRGADSSAELSGGMTWRKPLNNFTIQDLKLSVQQEAEAPWWSPHGSATHGVIVHAGTGACSDFVIQDCIFDGDLLPMRDGGWLTTNTSFALRTCSDFIVRRCTFQNAYSGPAVNGCSDFLFEDNLILDRHSDGFVLNDSDDDCVDGIIRNNHIVGIAGGMRYHSDGIQWQPNGVSNTIARMRISGNTLSPGAGPWCAQADPELGYQIATHVAGDFTVPSTEHCHEVRVVPGTYVITLPAASTGRQHWFRRTGEGASVITFALAGADTYSGGTTPTLTAEGDYWAAMSDGVSEWTDAPTGPNVLPYNMLVTSSRTLSTLEEGQTVTIDATAGDVVITLPVGATTTYSYAIVRIDTSANDVTLVKTGGDTITVDGEVRTSVPFVFGYSIDISGAGGVWTATEDPVATQVFFGNDDINTPYADTEIDGNISFNLSGVGMKLEVLISHDPALDNFRFHNNTFLPWLSDDMNDDGEIGQFEGNDDGISRSIYLPGDDSFGWSNFTTGSVITAASATGAGNSKVGLDIDSISVLVQGTNVGAEALLDNYFNGTTRAEYRPSTRGEVISAALAKASGALDGTYIGAAGTTSANGYYNFDTGEVNTVVIAPTLTSSDPADGTTTGADAAITLTFSQFLTADTGNFYLRNVTDATTIETFNIATELGNAGGTISIYANEVTITPGADMPDGKNCSIRWDAGVVKGHYGTDVAVNNGDTLVNFLVDAGLQSDFTAITTSHTRMSRSGLTGHGTETKILFACNAFRDSTSDALGRIIFLDSATDFNVAFESSGQLRIQAGSTSFRVPLGTPTSSPRETILMSIDLTQSSVTTGVKFYRNGVEIDPSTFTLPVFPGTSVVYVPTTSYLFDGATLGSNSFNGEVGFIYYDAPASLPDLDDPAVRALFDSEELISSVGEGPTGAAPLIFMHGDAAWWNAGGNLGSGGSFAAPSTPVTDA